MKKCIVAILAVVYLGVSSGIAMEIHYCMGKRAGVEFFTNDNDQCSRCGMKENKGGCCSDEHKFFKLKDSHKNVSNDLSFEAPQCEIENILPPYQHGALADAVATEVNNHSPPIYHGPSACIMNCVFRL